MAYPYLIMITLIRPILFSFLNSEKVKRLIVDLLAKWAEQSDNTVDDQAVKFIERGLFGGPLDWSSRNTLPGDPWSALYASSYTGGTKGRDTKLQTACSTS